MLNSQTRATVLIASPCCGEESSLLGRVFTQFGLDHLQALPARDCEEAWSALHSQTVDVLIVDDEFPAGQGWRELLDEIADMGGHQPVIVASRTADERLWAEALNLGAYDVLAKPFDAHELARIVEMAVRQAAELRVQAKHEGRQQVVASAVA